MADISSTGPLAGSGAYPKTAEELNKLVEAAVDKAIRSLKVEDQSRLQEARQPAVSKIGIVVAFVSALFTVVGVQLGSIYWLNDSIRTDLNAQIGSINAQIGSINAEIGSLRAEIGSINAEIGSLRAELRAEISELRSDMREDFRLLEAKFEAKFDEVWAELGDIQAELGELRSEIGALSERMARIEVVMQDRLPAAP